MAGYTRQSTSQIINGANITAPPLNAEFNQLVNAFGPGGHSHDGSSGNAPKIELSTSVDGYLPAVHGGTGGKNNPAATSNPTNGDDANDGYARGSFWYNYSDDRWYICYNNAVGSAVWRELLTVETGSLLEPALNNTVDLGSNLTRFKNIFLSGNVDASGNASLGGTLSVTGSTALSSTLAVTGNTSLTGTLGVVGDTSLANLAVSGTTNLNGNVVLGDATSDTIAYAGRVSTNVLPSADDAVDLGSADNEWRNLYIDGIANIDDLVADQVDINAGAIDNTTIGANTAVSAAFDGLTVNGSVDMSGASVSNLGSVATADINGGTIDGAALGASTPLTEATVDNVKLDGNSITSTNTDGNLNLTPNGNGSVVVSKIDANSGTIDGTAIGSAVADTGAFTTLNTSGQATLNSAVVTGGTIDGTSIGGSTPSTGAFTTVSASAGFSGDVTGNLTGNTAGSHTGPVSGDVVGNVTGNITSAGTSTFNNVTVNGELNMDAATTATIVNLTDPTSAQDAATKNYVDTSITNLIDGAPDALNTLNELAAALADDANAYGTLDTKINTKLAKSGDTMTGALDMGANKVTSSATPSANSDLTNKTYVDAQRDTRVAKSGDTMSGDLAMGSNKVTGLSAPTDGGDAANKTYVDTILGSAVAAATSASNALTSETNSANSATAAASSATSAAADLVSVQGLYDQFDDRYLGAHAVAPTVDNDGDALVVGALFFDTSTSSMKVYSASGWVPAGSSVNGTSARFKYTCTANQNTFSGADDNSNSLEYDAGYLDVFVNGVKLVNGDDFTATTGTSIQLLFNTTTADTLEVIAYGTFTLADLEMDDLNDVTTVGITNGQVLKYDTANSQFIAGDADVVTDAVNTAAVQDAAITTVKIADDAVTQAKIAAGAIGDTEIGTVNATALDYNNTVSGISANTVQEAIDYLNTLSGGSSGSVASYTRDKFVATAGQTTFTPSNGYTLGYLQVFINGILLDITDYTATDETTVVLTDAADLNDEVVIIALDSFAIAEILRVTSISASAPDNVLSANANGSVSVNTPSGGGEILRLNGGTYTSPLYAGGLSVTSNTSSNYNRYWEMDASAGLTFTRKGTSDGVADATPLHLNTAGVGIHYTSPQYAVHIGGGSANKRRILVDDVNSAGANAGVMFRLGDTNGAVRTGGVYFEPRTGSDSFIGISGDNSSVHMSVSQLGYVTTPLQPAFNAKVDGVTTYATSGWHAISAGTLIFQRGSHYNTQNSSFTAPVSGWYHFSLSVNFDNGYDVDGAISLSINGVTTNTGLGVMQSQNGGNYNGRSTSGSVYLAAGDSVQMYVFLTQSMVTRNNPWAGYFSGHLLG